MVQDKYSDYLDSGLMWVREYPSHWNLTKVKYEAYVKARVGWHGLKTDDFTDVGPYLVTGSDFKSSIISWKDCYHCDLERYEQDPYIQLQNGDLLLTKDGTIGKIALVQGLKDDEKATLNSGVFVVRPLRNSFMTEFYFWLLESSVFKKFVDYHKTGSTIVHLYQGTFVEFSYASPPLDEQAQIANFLDFETAQIDTLIEKQQTLIRLLKEKRQAVISHAVTKGLNPDAPMKDSGVEWLGSVPEHWEVSKLKFVSDIIDCRNKTPEYFENGEYFVVRTTNVRHQKLNFNGALYTDKKNFDIWTQRGVPPAGSILFTREAPTGEVCLVPENLKFCMGQRMMNFIAHNESYTNYLFDYLISDCLDRYINSVSHGSTVTHLRVEQVQNIPVLVPPLEEIIQIHKHIEQLKLSFDNIELNAKKAIQLMQERRTALISAAVTGKIDVRGWQAPDVDIL